ncbi:MAG: hypothetical protein JHC87_06505, partial [Thermoleophilaceae bacterium]|nr:hypothetical protein [Thermoleophilaceae bacterium]
ATGEAVSGGVQLALAFEPLAMPPLRTLGKWQNLLADYATTGVTTGEHPLSILRGQLGAEVSKTADLARLRDGAQVQVAGLVVARQRPGTANGVVFVLLEDEVGTINIVLTPKIYERFRVTVRGEPLLIVEGRLEHRSAAVNVLATRVRAIEPAAELAGVRHLPPAQATGEDGRKDQAGASEIRAVAPVGMNFGRRGR